MNLIVHSAYGVCFLDSVDCSAVKKDGRYIFELVDRCIEEIGVQNVVQVVTDNAKPNEAAASLLKAKHPTIFWNGCAAHTIDLMLEDIGKMPKVAETISKAKCLTVFLYAHTRVLSLMRKILCKDLVRCGVTRFATAYLNLKSLRENKKQLQKLFMEDEFIDLGYLNGVKGKKANKIVKSETFWKGVEIAVNYFEPLCIVLRRMDSDVPAMGFLYGSLVEAKNEISRRFNNDSSKFEEVFHIIDKRWDSKLKTPLHRAGYYLNPFYYYQNKVAIEENESFRDGVITCITKLVPDENTQDKIIEELELFQDAQGSFGKDIAKRQYKSATFDPGMNN
jgi:mannose-1-phosphate guanylyltransferase